MATIGFIGLGNMGAPMAANLVKAGHRVTGYDLNPAALQALTAAGGTLAERVAGRCRHHHAAGRRACARGLAAPGRPDRGGGERPAAADRLLHHRCGQRSRRHGDGAVVFAAAGDAAKGLSVVFRWLAGQKRE
jgi:hypothetical protein